MKFAEKLVFVYIFILGLSFTFLVPPLQKPDEHGHFKRAVYLRQGYIFLWNDGKKLPLDKQLYELINNKSLNAIPYRPTVKFNPNIYQVPLFSLSQDFKPVYIKEKAEFMLGAFAYIPHATGLFLARILHLNAFVTFFTGRFAMFLCSFIWMIFLYKKTKKPYKYILLFAFSLPMTIHQISAYNYDGMNFMMGFTLFSVFTRLYVQKKLSNRNLTIFGITLFLFLISKVIYEPLLLIALLIPYKKISPQMGIYMKKMCILLLAIIIGYFILKSPIYVSSLSYREHPVGVNPSKQILYILNNPIQYTEIFITSAWNLKKFHLQSAIGIFGWLDYSMDAWMYFVWIVGAVFMIYKLKLKKNELMNTRSIIFLYMIIFIEYAFIQTFFYLNWKQVGSPVIDGTQGRYFISLIPFVLLGIVQIKYNQTMKKILMTIILLLFTFLIIRKIILRYYDISFKSVTPKQGNQNQTSPRQ